jgi:hypothetical protein
MFLFFIDDLLAFYSWILSEKLSFSKQYTLYKYVYEIDDIYII